MYTTAERPDRTSPGKRREDEQKELTEKAIADYKYNVHTSLPNSSFDSFFSFCFFMFIFLARFYVGFTRQVTKSQTGV